MKDRIVSFIKRIALRLNMIPGSLRMRSYFKRMFIGEVAPLPEKVYENMSTFEEPREITLDKENGYFKIIYAVAEK